MIVTYYAADSYMGWAKWNFEKHYLGMSNWIRSGNSIKAKGFYIRDLDTFKTWAHLNKETN